MWGERSSSSGGTVVPSQPLFKSVNRIVTALLSFPEDFVADLADRLENHLERQGAAGSDSSERDLFTMISEAKPSVPPVIPSPSHQPK